MSESESDYDDPLFGIQKRKLRKSPPAVKKTTQFSILDALKAHSKKNDDLGMELGFKIRENDDRDTKRIHLDLVNIEDRIKRRKHVAGVLINVNKHIEGIKDQNKFVDKFLEENLWEGFRNEERNAQYIANLRKQILESVQSGDEKLIPRNFKFFINRGVCKQDNPKGPFFESDSLEYIEQYKGELKIGDFDKVLSQLGCDFKLVHHGPEYKFDRLEPLVYPMAIQVLKFVKVIDNVTNFERDNVIKALLLMSIDENLELDLTRVEYKDTAYTGRQLVVLKIMEIASEQIFNFLDLVSEFFEFDSDIWIKVINGLYIVDQTKKERQLYMLNWILLRFMIDNDTDDGCNFQLRPFANPEAITGYKEYVMAWSKCQLKEVQKPEFSLILNKMQCLERIFILNREVIADEPWAEVMKASLIKMKTRYFKNHYSSLSPVIPKMKSIIEFITTEIGDHTINDFFADTYKD